jgi:hypothetical protein
MIKIDIDYGPCFDSRGQRLPAYVVTHAVCDLCKFKGEPVYGDSEYDKGSARAKAGLGFVFNTTGGQARELCATCRTVKFEYHGALDDRGRRHFAILWAGDCLWNKKGRPNKAPGPHVRERGQHFLCDPKPYIESYLRRGFVVIEIDKP